MVQGLSWNVWKHQSMTIEKRQHLSWKNAMMLWTVQPVTQANEVVRSTLSLSSSELVGLTLHSLVINFQPCSK
jgi:hypothetical protein